MLQHVIRMKINMRFKSGETITPALYADIAPALSETINKLFDKYNIICAVEYSVEKGVFIYMFVPEELAAKDFNVGRHMVGVSRYIKAHCPELWSMYMNGTGLFTYDVIEKEPYVYISKEEKS